MSQENLPQNRDILFEERPRATFGFICLPTDLMADAESSAVLSQLENVRWRLQRLKMDGDTVCAKTYQSASDHIFAAAETIRPKNSVDVIGLSCTSLSFTLGQEAVNKKMKQAHPDAKVTNMASSVVEALNFIGGENLLVLSPYSDDLAARNIAMLQKSGFEVQGNINLGLTTDEQISSVSQDTIRECVREMVEETLDADTIFIGCSAFATLRPGFIDSLEQEFKKPVVTSMQAMLWNMLRLAEIDDPIYNFGSLLYSPETHEAMGDSNISHIEKRIEKVSFDGIILSHDQKTETRSVT